MSHNVLQFKSVFSNEIEVALVMIECAQGGVHNGHRIALTKI